MTLRELVEAKAREAAIGINDAIQKNKWQSAYRAVMGGGPVEDVDVAAILRSAIIATLNECGFREALEELLEYGHREGDTAKSKLKELEEMSK